MIDHRSYTHNLSSCEIKALTHGLVLFNLQGLTYRRINFTDGCFKLKICSSLIHVGTEHIRHRLEEEKRVSLQRTRNLHRISKFRVLFNASSRQMNDKRRQFATSISKLYQHFTAKSCHGILSNAQYGKCFDRE